MLGTMEPPPLMQLSVKMSGGLKWDVDFKRNFQTSSTFKLSLVNFSVKQRS